MTVSSWVRQRRGSQVLEDAQQRMIDLKTIGSKLEFNPKLTLGNFDAEIEQFRAELEAYNRLLAQLDAARTQLLEREKNLKNMTTDLLTGVASQFGKDSSEYQMAGGTRRSERKRPVRKSKAVTN
jgi:uncharacterized protein YukE